MTTVDGEPQEPSDDGLGFAAMSRALGSALAGLPPDQPVEGSRDAPVPAVAPQALRPDVAALAVADRILAAAGHVGVGAGRSPTGANVASTTAVPKVPTPPRTLPPPRPDAVGTVAPARPAVVERASGVADDLTVRRQRTALAFRTTDGRDHALANGAELTIGRDGSVSDIAIERGEISRSHLRITEHGGTVSVTDLGSTNGTTIVRHGIGHDLRGHAAEPLIIGDVIVVLDDIVIGEVVETVLPTGQSQ